MKSKIQLIFVVEKSSCKTLIYPASSYVLGGTHMTNPALLVGRILKELTATEDTFYGWDPRDLVDFDQSIDSM